jgi:hypothetical protein
MTSEPKIALRRVNSSVSTPNCSIATGMSKPVAFAQAHDFDNLLTVILGKSIFWKRDLPRPGSTESLSSGSVAWRACRQGSMGDQRRVRHGHPAQAVGEYLNPAA